MSDQVNWGWHDRELGTRYLILETLFKHWPANMWVQGPLDCLAEICDAHSIDPAQIAHIEVTPTVPMIMGNRYGSYEGILDAQFHLPYCLAAYLLDRNPGAHWFSEERRNDEQLLALAGKVGASGDSLTPFEAFEIFWTGSFPEVTVTVEMNDGARYHNALRYPKGHPRNSFTWAETEELFRQTASVAIPATQIERIIQVVRNLEGASDLHDLAVQTTTTVN